MRLNASRSRASLIAVMASTTPPSLAGFFATASLPRFPGSQIKAPGPRAQAGVDSFADATGEQWPWAAGSPTPSIQAEAPTMAPRHYDDPRYPTGRQDDDLSGDYGARHEPRSWREADSAYGRGYGRNQGYQQGASTTQGGFRPGEWGQDDPGRHGGGTYGQGSYGQGSHDRSWDEPHRHGHDATGRYGHQRMGQGGMMNQGRYDEPQQYYGVQGRHSQFADDRYGAGDTHAYGRGAPEISRGYAPGSQIWESQGQGPEFEPDYLHWRESQ